MLARKSYTAAEVATARSAMDRWLAAASPDIVDALVIALDAQFLHRMRGQEGKAADSPLKRARTLAEAAGAGEAIDLDLAGLRTLADEFYAEIEIRFPPD